MFYRKAMLPFDSRQAVPSHTPLEYRDTSAITSLRLQNRSVGVSSIQEYREQNRSVSVFLNQENARQRSVPVFIIQKPHESGRSVRIRPLRVHVLYETSPCLLRFSKVTISKVVPLGIWVSPGKVGFVSCPKMR